MKKVILLITVFATIMLSGCAKIQGYEFYGSNATFMILNEDGSKRYWASEESPALLLINLRWEYFAYRYESASAIVGTPIIYHAYIDEMRQKLSIFLKWAKLPYEERLLKLNETQDLLPNNIPGKPNPKSGTTDFILFHDDKQNPYLALQRSISYFGADPYLSISPSSAIAMLSEIKYIKLMREKYQRENNIAQ